MVHGYASEALDRTITDVMDVSLAFGSKIVILGGDFCQVLLVVFRME